MKRKKMFLNKFMVFLFTILTFGLFLVPTTFAKRVYPETLAKTNIVSNIERIERPANELYEATYQLRIYFEFDSSLITYFNNSHIDRCVLITSLNIFDSDFNFIRFNINDFNFTNGKIPSVALCPDSFSNVRSRMPLFDLNIANNSNYDFVYSTVGLSGPFFYKGDNDLTFSIDNFNGVCNSSDFSWVQRGFIELNFNDVSTLNRYSNYYYSTTFVATNKIDFVNQLPGVNLDSTEYLYYYLFYLRNMIPISYNFVSNDTYYKLYSGYGGVFYNTKVSLLMQRVSSEEDITESVISYNSIQFDGDLASRIANNNSRDTYQYYLKLYLNLKVRDFVNLNISRLRLNAISINGVYYTYEQARNTFPGVFYNNIDFVSDNSTLFVNGLNLMQTDIKDYVIDYIIFDFVDYTFTHSEYFNEDLGVLGYIENSYISVFDYNTKNTYDRGFNDGSKIGYKNGYEKGVNDGINSGDRSGFDNLMFAIADVPMKIISSMLDFELLGFNLMGFFLGIITLLLFVKLMRKFKE